MPYVNYVCEGDTPHLFSWFGRALPLASSIDSFLEDQSTPGDAIGFLGKYLITNIISEAESKSPLFRSRKSQIDFGALSKTWLGKLWSKTNRGGGARIDEKGLSDISFLTFNYDRCIEQFLFLAFSQYYRMDSNEATRLVNGIRIHHVYGSLGNPFASGDGLRFGQRDDTPRLISTANLIKTYSEKVESHQINAMSQILNEAERVVFLGFSYAPINQRILEEAIGGTDMFLEDVFGTAYGLSVYDTQRATNWMNAVLLSQRTSAIVQKSTAADFFDKNSLLFDIR